MELLNYQWIKLIHIVSSVLLFGTGLGSAYYLWFAHLRGDVGAIAVTARNVVIADWLFTTPTVVIQPVTGLLMVYVADYSLTQSWLYTSIGLFVLAGACWLPVVWLQIRIRDIVEDAVRSKQQLPTIYHRYMQIWFWLGVPAFCAMLAVFFLMVMKPM